MKNHFAMATIGVVIATAGFEPLRLQEPTFEFVSIRRVSNADAAAARPTPVARALPGGRFEAHNISVEELARFAYGFEHVDPRGLVE